MGGVYSGLLGSVIAGGCHYLPPWVPSPGVAASISANTLSAINPANDALANPNYPTAAPWDRSAGWSHCLDYGGVCFANDLGSLGTIVFYAGAGHSATNPTMWAGFDLATRQWKRIGKRSLPNDDMYLGLSGYPGVLDSTWGDYDGSASAWGAFAHPGYNPPAGSHNYAGIAYRPAAKSGNSKGQLLYPLNASGATAGNTARGSWVWDGDTELFTRSANLRPGSGGGATVGGTVYFEGLDSAFALNTAGSLWLMYLDWFDWSTKTWTRRNSTDSDKYANLSGVAFGHEAANLYIVCVIDAGNLRFFAAPVDKVVSGVSWSWTELTVTGDKTIGVRSWCWHSHNGCWYGVNGVVGSSTLYKLTAPSNSQAAALSDTWTITSQTFSGETLYCKNANGTDANVDNFRYLTYAPKARCLLWLSPYVGGAVQAIRPSS